MFYAILAAAAAMNGAPDTCAPKSPNHTPMSVHVQSVNNPTYAFPAGANQPVLNGRVYKGRPIIGGSPIGARTDAAHAAASFGAFGEEATRVQTLVEGPHRVHPTAMVEFSPWTPVPQQQASPYSDPYSRAHQKMAKRAEDARQQWLKDHNYVGGVRTHINDAVLYNLPAPRVDTSLPQPRGVLQINPEVPAFKSRMRVQAKPTLPIVAARSTAPKVLPMAGKVAEPPITVARK